MDVQGRLKDGKIAAIKVLSAESRQGLKEFLTEIQVISEIEHENLVKLYGCCVEGNHRILVYNYLENNSLAQTLIGNFLNRFLVLSDVETKTLSLFGQVFHLVDLHTGCCSIVSVKGNLSAPDTFGFQVVATITVTSSLVGGQDLEFVLGLHVGWHSFMRKYDHTLFTEI